MHRDHASGAAAGDTALPAPDEEDSLEPAPVDPVVPMLATEAAFEPPHAAADRTSAVAPAASGSA
jgi:hypothetical protein